MLIFIALILLPFGALSPRTLIQGQQYSFLLCGLLFAAWQVKNPWLRWFLYYVALWIGFSFVGLAYIEFNPQISKAVLETLFFFTAGTLAFLAVTNSKRPNSHFYNAICVLALIQAVCCWLQYFGVTLAIGPFDVSGVHKMHNLPADHMPGFLYNDDFAMGLLAMSIPFFVRRPWYWGLALVAPLLLVSGVATAVMAATVGMLVFYFGLWGLLSLTVIGVIGWVSDSKVLTWNPRYEWWINVLKTQFSSWPSIVFGFGPGASWDKVLQHSIHSEWVTLLYQYGLIGFSLIVGYVRSIQRKNRVLLAAFVIAVFNMLGNPALHVAPSALLIIVVLALMERERNSLFKVLGYMV